METATINVRVNAQTKQRAEALFRQLGLTMSSAVSLFLNKAIEEEGIPFEVKLSPNAASRAAMAEMRDMEAHPERYPRYATFSDVMKDVLADA